MSLSAFEALFLHKFLKDPVSHLMKYVYFFGAYDERRNKSQYFSFGTVEDYPFFEELPLNCVTID
jgi:hypothetical protein